MDYINAFWVGGLICALVQILMEKTKMLPGRIMVLLVCTGSILGALGIYQPLIDFAGAGVENVQKRLMLAVNIGHEVLRGLGQIQDGLEPDDLRARGLHRGVLPGKQPQIVQLLVGKNTLVIHMILPFRHEASLPFVIVTPSGIRQGVQWSYDHGKMAGRWCHLCVINRQNLS